MTTRLTKSDLNAKLMLKYFSLSWKKSVPPVETKTAPSHNWHVGEKVMAVFDEDGLEYRAKILIIKNWKDAAVVKFTEYGNEEEVNFSELSKMDKKPSKVSRYKS